MSLIERLKLESELKSTLLIGKLFQRLMTQHLYHTQLYHPRHRHCHREHLGTDHNCNKTYDKIYDKT